MTSSLTTTAIESMVLPALEAGGTKPPAAGLTAGVGGGRSGRLRRLRGRCGRCGGRGGGGLAHLGQGLAGGHGAQQDCRELHGMLSKGSHSFGNTHKMIRIHMKLLRKLAGFSAAPPG